MLRGIRTTAVCLRLPHFRSFRNVPLHSKLSLTTSIVSVGCSGSAIAPRQGYGPARGFRHRHGFHQRRHTADIPLRNGQDRHHAGMPPRHEQARYRAGTPARDESESQGKETAFTVSAHGSLRSPQRCGSAAAAANEPADEAFMALSLQEAEQATPQGEAAVGVGMVAGAQVNADEAFMALAVQEAEQAASRGEVPVGAVMVADGQIIARARNKTEALNDPTAHAEMLCIREASRKLGSWKKLKDATLYVTLEPCPMCAGAILQARVGTVVWGAKNTLLGADGSWTRLLCSGVPRQQGPSQGPQLQSTEKVASEEEGSDKPDAGMPPTLLGPFPQHPQHPFQKSLVIRRFVLQDECSQIMKSFFRARRTQAPQPQKSWNHVFKFFNDVFRTLTSRSR